MYAIVDTGGKQIRVAAGDNVCVENVNAEINSEVSLDKVLMISKDGGLIVGKPYVEGASVRAEIIGSGKSEKVLILRPRPKKAIRRLRGHRQKYTTLKIKEIIGG